MSGSCDWALAIPALHDFLISEVSETFRIGGAPGSGKSTLAACIVRYLMHTAKGDVLYFFCKGTSESKMKPFQVLRTLISQLLSRDDSLFPWFETLYQQSGQKEADSFASLQHSFHLALRNTAKPIIYIVVDALDECQDNELLIPFLMETSKKSNRAVKLLLTSRDDPELLDYFQEPISQLIISPQDVLGPVSQYIRERIARSKRISQSGMVNQIHQDVTNAADGLWLFAKLMMDEIERLPSPGSIIRQLQHLPTGVSRLYEQIFETMEKRFSPIELKLSQQAFLWIDMTFVLIGRSRLDREILDLVFEAASGEKVFDSIELAQSLCSPLVTLVPNAYRGSIEVDIVHHTAAQFMRWCSDDKTRDVPNILRPLKLKSLYHGNTAIWYFKQSPKSTTLLHLLRIKKFVYLADDESQAYFEMAYGLWDSFFLSHLPDCLDDNSAHEAADLCHKLTEFLACEACLKWVEMAMIINYSGGYSNLLTNARKALRASKRGIESLNSAFRSYSLKCQEFFADYVYVLDWTGPKYRDEESDSLSIMPDGFRDRPLAVKLLELGVLWASRVGDGNDIGRDFERNI